MRTTTPVIVLKALFAKNPNCNRVVLHSDDNYFYVSVEYLYNPDICDKPIAVCDDPEARQQCPDLIVVPAHYDLYRKFSRKLRHLYESYTDRVESYGLDEC